MQDGRRGAWIEWTRTELTPTEVREELDRLPASERLALEDVGWLWSPGRLLWRDRQGVLNRMRFTHGADFCTPKGEFHVDSSGGLRRIGDAIPDVAESHCDRPRAPHHVRPRRPPSLVEPTRRPRR